MALTGKILELIRNIATEREGGIGALKTIHLSDDKCLNEQAAVRLEREIDVLKKVRHPSLVRILDSFPRTNGSSWSSFLVDP